MNFMIFYDRLWTKLEEKHISQYKLGKIGISHSTIMRLKNNQYVNLSTIDKLCKLLQCSIEDIIEYRE